MNTTTIAPLLDLGIGNSATAHIIESVAAAYKDRGYKYGTPSLILLLKQLTNLDSIMVISGRLMGRPHSASTGEAHGKFYVELAEGESQGLWQQTFVKGVGYKHFPVA